MKHYKIWLFDYKRIGSVCLLEFNGKIIYKRAGRAFCLFERWVFNGNN